MRKSNKFSPEVRERAVRMVHEHRGEYPSLWAAIEAIAPKIGCVPQTLNEWGKRDEVDTAARAGTPHVRERTPESAGTGSQGTAPSQRDSQVGQRGFRPGGAGPPAEVLRAFIDQHRSIRVQAVCGSATRHRAAEQARPARCNLGTAHRTCLAGQPAGLRCRQGLDADEPGRHRRGTLHRGAPHA